MKDKFYFIEFDGLNSKIQYGRLKDGDMNCLKPNDLISLEHREDLIKLKKCNIYRNRIDAEFNLNIYLAKKEYKLEYRDKVCNCFYCKQRLDYRDFTVDHKKPVSLYPELASNKRNFVIACEDCNKEKSDKDFLEFKQKKEVELKEKRKIEVIEKKKVNRSKKPTEKIGRTIKCNEDNVMEFAKKDSRIWDLNSFFSKNKCSV